MEDEKKETCNQNKLNYPLVIHLESSDSWFMGLSILAIFAIGGWFASISYYQGAGYNVLFSLIALFVAMFITKNKLTGIWLYFMLFDLILPMLVGMFFFQLYKNVQSFNLIIFVLAIAALSFISLVKVIKGAVIVEGGEKMDVRKMAKACLRSESFSLTITLIIWLIFFTMFQSWLLMMDSHEEAAIFTVIYGAIIAFVFSLPVVFIGIILSLRKVAKGLSVILRLFFLSAIAIMSWIVISSVISAIVTDWISSLPMH